MITLGQSAPSHMGVFSATDHARQMLIGQIMALAGRSSRDPAAYLRLLNGFSLTTLQRTRDDLMGVVDDAITHHASRITSPTLPAPAEAADEPKANSRCDELPALEQINGSALP